MAGFRIFTHSIRMVFGNLGAAIPIFGILYIPHIIMYLIPAPVAQVRDGAWLFVTAYLAGLAATLLLFVWMAVAWHRYILLGERSHAIIPLFRRDRWAAYVRVALRLGLILVLIAFVGVCALLIAAPLLPPFMTEIANFGLSIVVSVIGYRLAAVLPASAAGRDLSMREAWEATRGANWAIVVVAILWIVAEAILDMVGGFFAPASAASTAWLAVTYWVGMVVGVTILTTIYGHYIEGRPIN